MRFSASPSRMFDRFGDGFDAQALVGPEAPASRPVLLAVDEDAGDLREISRELHKRYGGTTAWCARGSRKRPCDACETWRGRARRSRSFSPTSGWRG